MAKRLSGRLIVVSNRLPYYKDADSAGKPTWKRSPGGLVTALEPIIREINGLWVGWDGVFLKHDHSAKSEIRSASHLGIPGTRKDYKLLPISLTRKEIEKYYSQFSNNTLWGLFHYFFEKSSIDYSSWEIYKKVNEKFALSISKVAGEKDYIWINDFHLLLCPFFLRRINPKYKIHFYLHIPFPHVDIFSTLPWGRELLDSLACCDSLGFQHPQYMKNYQGVVQELGAGRKPDRLSGKPAEDTKPFTYVNPISIDFDKFDKTSRKVRVKKRKKELIKQNNYLKMILGVDRLDYSKGIKQKLLGIEKLLDTCPELAGEFCFYQLAIPSRESVAAYRSLKKDIDELVGRINGKFSTGTWHPIQYMYTSVPFDELIAFYSAADIALITPLRDGMNLVCKEFVASHSDNDGVLVLSRFAGASMDLKNSLAVNPYSIEDICKALREALAMPGAERKRKMERMRENVRTNDINVWFDKILSVFEYTEKEGESHV
ncbi:MAG: trehalose-6-phosphate synthase [Candidatus Omnitrophica bacterium]|nr:trehalose-6-phosphate synthase [Candidatus Omnitrophota bacterium]